MDRKRIMQEAIHSGEMEGAYVSAQFNEDAEDYAQGSISIQELARRTKRRWQSRSGKGKTSNDSKSPNAPDEFTDPYADLRHNVLRNKVGATTYDELRNAEGEFVALRMCEFFETPIVKPSGTLDDLRRLHKMLFQDIYDCAGEIRTVEMRKAIEGSEFFLPSCNIAMGIAWAYDELKKDHLLKGLPLDGFAERIAYHYDNYNFVHPFREGNGRTQRLLWTLLSHDASYDLHWQDVAGEENDNASRRAAEKQDLTELVKMFSRIAVPCDPNVPINRELIASSSRVARPKASENLRCSQDEALRIWR